MSLPPLGPSLVAQQRQPGAPQFPALATLPPIPTVQVQAQAPANLQNVQVVASMSGNTLNITINAPGFSNITVNVAHNS